MTKYDKYFEPSDGEPVDLEPPSSTRQGLRNIQKISQKMGEYHLVDDETAQKHYTAVLAVNALSRNRWLRPSKMMLERACAPEDNEDEAEERVRIWGFITERAYTRFRTRGVTT